MYGRGYKHLVPLERKRFGSALENRFPLLLHSTDEWFISFLYRLLETDFAGSLLECIAFLRVPRHAIEKRAQHL